MVHRITGKVEETDHFMLEEFTPKARTHNLDSKDLSESFIIRCFSWTWEVPTIAASFWTTRLLPSLEAADIGKIPQSQHSHRQGSCHNSVNCSYWCILKNSFVSTAVCNCKMHVLYPQSHQMDSGTCISLFLPRSHRQNLNHVQKYEEGFIKSDISE